MHAKYFRSIFRNIPSPQPEILSLLLYRQSALCSIIPSLALAFTLPLMLQVALCNLLVFHSTMYHELDPIDSLDIHPACLALAIRNARALSLASLFVSSCLF